MIAIDEELSSSGITTSSPLWITDKDSIGHSGLPNQIHTSTDQPTTGVGTLEIGISEISIFQGMKIGSAKTSTRSIDIVQVSSPQISVDEATPMNIGSTQIGIPNDSFTQTTTTHENSPQIGSSQIGSNQVDLIQESSSQVDISQNNTLKIDSTIFSIPAISRINQFDSSKVTFPISVPLQQLIVSNLPTSIFPSHNLNSNNLSQIQNNLLNLFDPTFNIDLQIADLPTGQLAEAQITKYDQYGRPNGGTILIDNDANGYSWFIDQSPFDNTEFSQTLTDTAYRATTGDAVGKYDLLTSILHEMGHLAGIIAGNPGFDRNVQTINGAKIFVGDNFTATLTPDGSHLDSTVHPYDLMNNTLAPGVRKLPSWLNLQMVNAVRNTTIAPSSITQLKAPLSAILLADISNGNFSESDTTKPEYGWSTRGAATILNKEAVLTEDSPFNSNFTQSFIIPEGAKYLQFTLKNTTLGANTPTSPGDAFEVALLNANTKASLLSTATGLTQTDSLLNIQNDGTAYTSNKVTLVNTTPATQLTLNQPLTFKVDLTGIQALTAATLYFDLLGFGDRNAKVVLDNVMLLNNDLTAPVANNDAATTNQTKPVTINVLTNDTDADSTIDPTKIAMSDDKPLRVYATNPTNGTTLVNQDGTVTYTPNATFVGTDTVTDTVTDTDGLTSNTATVNITVNNIAPVITVITGDTTTTEGTAANFNAQATDPGDNIDYIWNFGDGSALVLGQNATHTYADNGTYIATLIVRDTIFVRVASPEENGCQGHRKGISSFQTLNVTVNNAAPIVDAGTDVTIDEGKAIAFNGSFTDPGILDTHTITCDIVNLYLEGIGCNCTRIICDS